MRILVAVAHVHNPTGAAHYGSSGPARRRAKAVTRCLRSLFSSFSPTHDFIDHEHRGLLSAAASRPHEVDVVVCSLPELNLLDEIPPELFRVRWVDVPPLFVPFSCRDVLAQGLGDYDWFCYIEDDLVFHDPLFFDKLRWFQDAAGPGCVLQPNRYEVAPNAVPRKIYVDGPLDTGGTAKWQDLADVPEVHLSAFGSDIRLIRPSNPHAGGFFLTSDQMAAWVGHPSFSDRDCSFVGPLESAASLGLMQTFRVYKPSPEDAAFLEIEHLDRAWARRGMGDLPWPE